MNKLVSIVTLFILTVSNISLSGQNSIKSLYGKITDDKGKTIPYATVSIKDRPIGTTSKEDGTFALTINNCPNEITLLIRCIGYTSEEKQIQLDKNGKKGLTITLKTSNTSIGEVTVNKKSKTTEKNEIPYTIKAIDAKPMQTRNLDVSQLLNTVAGVKIRETGGLGSDFTFTLNGFSGNQIKFFIDGIPMDYFGSSLSINNFPINLISSVEVYKGVVPIEFGSDALGGAVNLVTNQNSKSFIDASYSYGSFNTHRAALVSQYTFSNQLQVKVNAYYNYSDNNYKIWVDNVDTETSSIDGEIEVNKFHDAYESKTGQFEVGFVDKTFADKLFLGIIASKNYDEIQNGYNLSKAVGEAFEREDRFVSSLQYIKNGLFIKNLDAKLLTAYIYGTTQTVDTSSHVYDWDGNYTTPTLGSIAGEFTWFKTEYIYTDKATTSSLNLAYELFPGHKIAFNNSYSHLNRSGDDPIGYYATLFIETNKLTKNISGLSYDMNLLDGKFRSSLFAKYFFMTADMYDLDDDDNLTTANSKYNDKGAGIAISYFLLPELQVKASFENTYRLPENLEIFGNGLRIKPTPELKPEQSKNLNFGITWRKLIGNHHFAIEGSYLYRLAKDFIKMATSGNLSWYENYTDAKIHCYEADLKYNYKNKINININGTYQDILDNKKTTNTGGVYYLYGDRLPNMPYLFANGSAGYQFTPFSNKSNKISVDWNTNFVEEFYLKSPRLGNPDDKYTIPRQINHNISASIMLDDDIYNVSLACTNLTDSDLYDNYKMQKPGRAFSIKLRYFLCTK